MNRIALTLVLAFATFALVGCLGGGGGGSSSSTSPPAFPTVNVGGISTISTVAHAGVYDVDVSGVTVTVTIDTNQTIRNVNITGSSGDITIGLSSTVSGAVNLGGVSNALHLPVGSTITVNTTGTGCAVFYDSVAG